MPNRKNQASVLQDCEENKKSSSCSWNFTLQAGIWDQLILANLWWGKYKRKIQKMTSAPRINMVFSVVLLPHGLLSNPTFVQESLLLGDSSPSREMVKRQAREGSRNWRSKGEGALKPRSVKTDTSGPAPPCSLVWSSVCSSAHRLPAHSGCLDQLWSCWWWPRAFGLVSRPV